ncbi:MAG: hypothetical protein QW728_03865, partial [Thermoplasmata archaeon]
TAVADSGIEFLRLVSKATKTALEGDDKAAVKFLRAASIEEEPQFLSLYSSTIRKAILDGTRYLIEKMEHNDKEPSSQEVIAYRKTQSAPSQMSYATAPTTDNTNITAPPSSPKETLHTHRSEKPDSVKDMSHSKSTSLPEAAVSSPTVSSLPSAINSSASRADKTDGNIIEIRQSSDTPPSQEIHIGSIPISKEDKENSNDKAESVGISAHKGEEKHEDMPLLKIPASKYSYRVPFQRDGSVVIARSDEKPIVSEKRESPETETPLTSAMSSSRDADPVKLSATAAFSKAKKSPVIVRAATSASRYPSGTADESTPPPPPPEMPSVPETISKDAVPLPPPPPDMPSLPTKAPSPAGSFLSVRAMDRISSIETDMDICQVLGVDLAAVQIYYNRAKAAYGKGDYEKSLKYSSFAKEELHRALKRTLPDFILKVERFLEQHRGPETKEIREKCKQLQDAFAMLEYDLSLTLAVDIYNIMTGCSM